MYIYCSLFKYDFWACVAKIVGKDVWSSSTGFAAGLQPLHKTCSWFGLKCIEVRSTCPCTITAQPGDTWSPIIKRDRETLQPLVNCHEPFLEVNQYRYKCKKMPYHIPYGYESTVLCELQDIKVHLHKFNLNWYPKIFEVQYSVIKLLSNIFFLKI